ncbi:MAG: 3'-5' exonuclease [Bacteroidota bacterium]|nr:3'-5' exonuclease [Bacteroidota bacterium]
MYAIIDLETTGGKYQEESITEIAIYRYNGKKVVDSFVSLVNPEREIDPFVEKLTGITQSEVENAPRFFELTKKILEITEDSIIVAHDAQFDYRIIKQEFNRLGYDFTKRTLCTIEFSKIILPNIKSYNLDNLAKSLNLKITNRHRAYGDALATLEIFKLLFKKDRRQKNLSKLIRPDN